MNLNQITLPAHDINTSKTFYKQMGFIQIVDTDHYARFECPNGDATFSIEQVSDMTSVQHCVVYFETENLDHVVAQLKQKGFVFDHDPRDERWLWREARLRDPSGNTLCLYWAGENRKNPPWRINTPN